jgi:anti-sigma B factor antagonist
MKISVRNAGQVKVVDVEGDVDMGTSPDLRKILLATLPETTRLALNLEAIRSIDSSGIATLIEILKKAQGLKKEFVLFGLRPAVENVFKLTHVITLFQVYASEQEALGTS